VAGTREHGVEAAQRRAAGIVAASSRLVADQVLRQRERRRRRARRLAQRRRRGTSANGCGARAASSLATRVGVGGEQSRRLRQLDERSGLERVGARVRRPSQAPSNEPARCGRCRR
jgi:hypothetical protein